MFLSFLANVFCEYCFRDGEVLVQITGPVTFIAFFPRKRLLRSMYCLLNVVLFVECTPQFPLFAKIRFNPFDSVACTIGNPAFCNCVALQKADFA